MLLAVVKLFECRPHVELKVCTVIVVHKAALVQPRLKVCMLWEVLSGADAVHDRTEVDLNAVDNLDVVCLDAQMLLALVKLFKRRAHFVELLV